MFWGNLICFKCSKVDFGIYVLHVIPTKTQLQQLSNDHHGNIISMSQTNDSSTWFYKMSTSDSQKTKTMMISDKTTTFEVRGLVQGHEYAFRY